MGSRFRLARLKEQKGIKGNLGLVVVRITDQAGAARGRIRSHFLDAKAVIWLVRSCIYLGDGLQSFPRTKNEISKFS